MVLPFSITPVTTPTEKTGFFLILLTCLFLAYQSVPVGVCVIYDKDLLVETRLMRLDKQIKGAQTVNEYIGITSHSKSHIFRQPFKHHDRTLPSCFASLPVIQTRMISLFS